MRWLKGKRPDPVIIDQSEVSIPAMSQEAMVDVIEKAQGGPALAVLVFTEQSYEIISGSWSLFIASDGTRTYWVSDRIVAMENTDGTVDPVPSLVHLQTGWTVSVAQLINERISAA